MEQLERKRMTEGFDIGALHLDSKVVAAPMAGVTDSSYRQILREYGASLVYTEMISAKGLYYNNENTKFLLEHAPSESPVFVQLFGSDPQLIAEQAVKIQDGYEGIDLNMGCPAPKIVNNHEGSALLLQPELIGDIVSTLVKAVDKPVTVKFRKGFNHGDNTAVETARICEQAGASAVAVHARTRDQMYSGKADWDVIKAVKEAVSIPVIGNGDVVDGASALEMLHYTGCDAVMVGRASMGNPWVFTNIRKALETGKPEPWVRPSEEEVIDMIMRHARMVCEDKTEYVGIRQMRTHILWYMKKMPKAAKKRQVLVNVTSLSELEALLKG